MFHNFVLFVTSSNSSTSVFNPRGDLKLKLNTVVISRLWHYRNCERPFILTLIVVTMKHLNYNLFFVFFLWYMGQTYSGVEVKKNIDFGKEILSVCYVFTAKLLYRLQLNLAWIYFDSGGRTKATLCRHNKDTRVRPQAKASKEK